MKQCNKCKQWYPESEYYKNNRAKDGLQTFCKNCQKSSNKFKISHCIECGEEIIGEAKYCSKKCRYKNRGISAINRWKDKKEYIEVTGKVMEKITTNDVTPRKIAKRYLLEKYGHKCMMCGLSEWNGQPIMLICDHIDGDPTNINIDDFRLICPNCDATLPTYTARNMGNGRKSKGLKNI